MWTEASVKSYLPDTVIVLAGVEYPCRVTGRANTCATVTFGSVGDWRRCEVSWAAVVRSVNGQGSLRY
jgi:hypothetical protein